MIRMLLIFTITLFLSFDLYAQDNQSQWRGPGRNGYYPEKNLLSKWPTGGPELLWKFDKLGSGYSSPAIIGDKIIITGTIDSISQIFCFNKSGTLLWQKPLGPDYMGEYPGIYSTPAIKDGLGYVASSLGVVYCFSTVTGHTLWSKDLIREFAGKMPPGGFLDNLIVDGEKVICAPGGPENNVVALDRKGGQLIWKTQGTNEISGYGSPILIEFQGQRMYIYQDNWNIIALNPDNGSLLWKYKRNSQTNVGTPLYHDGYLFCMDEEGSILLKINSGTTAPERIWSNPEFFPLQGDPVWVDNRLYGKSKGKKFLTVDWNNGSSLSSIPTKSMVVTTIAADNKVLTYDIDGEFSLLKPVPAGLEIISTFKIPGGTKYHCTHPVIHGGVLYVRHDNSLFAYKISI